MNPVAKQYAQAMSETPPADPMETDLYVYRIPAHTFYTVMPFTARGRSFVLDHRGAGSIHGDALTVPMRGIFSFMNEVFDEGLSVL